MRGFAIALTLHPWPPTIAFQFEPDEASESSAATSDTVIAVDDTEGLMGFRPPRR